ALAQPQVERIHRLFHLLQGHIPQDGDLKAQAAQQRADIPSVLTRILERTLRIRRVANDQGRAACHRRGGVRRDLAAGCEREWLSLGGHEGCRRGRRGGNLGSSLGGPLFLRRVGRRGRRGGNLGSSLCGPLFLRRVVYVYPSFTSI